MAAIHLLTASGTKPPIKQANKQTKQARQQKAKAREKKKRSL